MERALVAEGARAFSFARGLGSAVGELFFREFEFGLAHEGTVHRVF